MTAVIALTTEAMADINAINHREELRLFAQAASILLCISVLSNPAPVVGESNEIPNVLHSFTISSSVARSCAISLIHFLR